MEKIQEGEYAGHHLDLSQHETRQEQESNRTKAQEGRASFGNIIENVFTRYAQYSCADVSRHSLARGKGRLEMREESRPALPASGRDKRC